MPAQWALPTNPRINAVQLSICQGSYLRTRGCFPGGLISWLGFSRANKDRFDLIYLPVVGPDLHSERGRARGEFFRRKLDQHGGFRLLFRSQVQLAAQDGEGSGKISELKLDCPLVARFVREFEQVEIADLAGGGLLEEHAWSAEQ